MSHVIFTRNPRSRGLFIMLASDGDNVMEYATEKEATEFAESRPVCKAWGYQIVEVGD
jgi:hypothetical protein